MPGRQLGCLKATYFPCTSPSIRKKTAAATQQRKLFGLTKGSYLVSEGDDPYICAVAQSEHLELVQEIVIWWRAYGLERYCPLTSAVLKRHELFDETVSTFTREQRISPFIEKLGTTFLEEMSGHEHSLIASVAQFELALIKVKQRDAAEYVVDWEYEPYTVLNSLINNLPLDEENTEDSYRTIVSGELPKLFLVVSVQS